MRKNISKRKERHCEEVYDAVYRMHKMVTSKDIENYLLEKFQIENKKHEEELNRKYENGDINKSEIVLMRRRFKPITLKTIQRCLKFDHRIDKISHYYFVSKQRFDSRFLDPIDYGRHITQSIAGDYLPTNIMKKDMEQLITRFGAVMLFCFIEAVKPFRQKGMSVRDKEDLVYYWALNSVRVDYLFDLFQGVFQQRQREVDWIRPPGEMNQKTIAGLLKTIKVLFPTIYSDFIRGRKRTFGKNIKSEGGGPFYDPELDLISKKKRLKRG